MINQGPRSDESRPIDPRRTHEKRQVVQNFLAQLKKEFPVKDSTDVENLIKSLKTSINEVNSHLGAIFNAHRDGGKLLDKPLFKDEAQRMYIEKLSRYSKDELHLLMVCVLSDLSVKEYI